MKKMIFTFLLCSGSAYTMQRHTAVKRRLKQLNDEARENYNRGNILPADHSDRILEAQDELLAAKCSMTVQQSLEEGQRYKKSVLELQKLVFHHTRFIDQDELLPGFVDQMEGLVEDTQGILATRQEELEIEYASDLYIALVDMIRQVYTSDNLWTPDRTALFGRFDQAIEALDQWKSDTALARYNQDQ